MAEFFIVIGGSQDMSRLSPVAFDIETSGVGPSAVITVAGFAHEMGEYLILNHAGRDDPDPTHLSDQLAQHSAGELELSVVDSEAALLEEVAEFVTERIDGDQHYLTAYNGETWNGGFDLPFCRTACIQHGMQWPFGGDLAYVDVFELIDSFATNDHQDLVGVYDVLIGTETPDPFTDSEQAVAAFEAGDWVPLLLHNMADIQRTRDLAVLAGQYVPKSDFSMKNLATPE